MLFKGLISIGLFGAYSLSFPFQTVLSGPKFFSSTAHEYGIGFDLSPEYGRVAVSYANGTAFDLGRTDGDEEYRETYKKLPMRESAHPACVKCHPL